MKSNFWGILLIFIFMLGVLLLLFWPVSGQETAVWITDRDHVIIDAGHGGIDGGAVGVGGSVEKDLNLAIARKCELLLGLCGVEVTMTRREDISLDDGTGTTIARRKADDIKKRVAMANAGADALISIHMNSFPDPQYWGTQTFYSKNHGDSAVLAEKLQTAARTLLAPENTRECKAAEDSIYLLRNVTVPAVIVECGFLTNPEEERRLNTEDYQKAAASAICAGILDYLQPAV